MAKGSIAKEIVFNKLLESFPGSFMYNDGKECRINIEENGDIVQIKVALTAAKTPVEPDGGSVGAAAAVSNDFDWSDSSTIEANDPSQPVKITEPTEEEKENLKRLVAKFDF